MDRLYEIKSGKISIDGKNIKDYELFSLRSRIGVVLQDVFLFGGSVKDNITFRDENISLETVRDAAIKIGADDFITKLPDNYDFKVSEAWDPIYPWDKGN